MSGHLCAQPAFKRGDPAPEGYGAWHEWAAAQHRAGLRQECCTRCGLWRFPQESCCDAPRLSSSQHRKLMRAAVAHGKAMHRPQPHD